MVVGGCGWLLMVVDFSITRIKISFIFDTCKVDCMFLSCLYDFQSESTLYSCLNVKELFARSRRGNWSLSDCNWTRSQNHLPEPGSIPDPRSHLPEPGLDPRSQNQIAEPNGWVFVYELSGSGIEFTCKVGLGQTLLFQSFKICSTMECFH